MRTLLLIGTAGGLLAASILGAEARAGRGSAFRLRGPIVTDDRPAVVPERAKSDLEKADPVKVGSVKTGLVRGTTLPVAASRAGSAAGDKGAVPPEASRIWSPEISAPPRAAEAPPVRGAARKVADATSWCRPGRLAGSGAGFCMIN